MHSLQMLSDLADGLSTLWADVPAEESLVNILSLSKYGLTSLGDVFYLYVLLDHFSVQMLSHTKI